MREEWRWTHNSNYQISNLGRIRSCCRQKAGRWKLLRPGVDTKGYFHVTLWEQQEREGRYRIHQLVAAAFIGPRPKGQEVRYKDGDRRNCRADNLLYGTHKENCQDAVRHGSLHMIKLTPADVCSIRALRGQVRQVDLAARFNVNQAQISAIQLGRKWACV